MFTPPSSASHPATHIFRISQTFQYFKNNLNIPIPYLPFIVITIFFDPLTSTIYTLAPQNSKDF